jgi:mono/diheme cytochrome c family protein
MRLRWLLPLLILSILIVSRPAVSDIVTIQKSVAAGDDKAVEVSYSQRIVPLLGKYCNGCHGGEKPKAGLALDLFKDEESIQKSRGVWEKVVRNIRSREMPPVGKPKPSEEEIELLASWVETQLAKVDCSKLRDPGRVTIRRLNRVEYRLTIRDLVGVTFEAADDFPADDVGYGFDNIGDVLSLPPILMEKYLAAAEKIVDQAFRTPEVRKRIMVREPTEQTRQETAREILGSFARRAYRRPVTPAEIERLARFVELAEKNGDAFETGIQLALQAILVSPHFLFRIEQDPALNSPDQIRVLNEWELATRLSYFLWSSMPDDQLFALAEKGELRRNLEAQILRMLQDPRSSALVENFAGQWLQTRNLKSLSPDPKQFPAFDEPLRSAMQKETELFFAALLKEDRPVHDLIDADFTFVNERLARHYGLADVRGQEFRRVSLAGTQRGGILTHASVLTVTSNPTRTSPVKRGKWILENLLGTPPPPPAPDAGELQEDKDGNQTLSLRQKMELHRVNPSCATCHQRMDPLGFAFENFDAIGAWRTHDGKFPIDSSGTLPGGQTFKGPNELKDLLKKQKEQFARCLSEKMLTYALGRGLEFYDKCAVDRIVEALNKNDHRFTVLVHEVVKSDPFQKRRGKGGDK